MGKKRYASVKYEFDMSKGKVSFSGVEAKRRDNCLLLKKTQLQLFDDLLKDMDERKALLNLHGTIRNLMTGKVDIDDLVISKKLSKANYAAAQVHVNVNEGIRKRSPGEAYKIGARVPFLIIKRSGKTKVADKGIDVPFFKANRDSFFIDTAYYYEKQIRTPMLRLIAPIVGHANALLFLERARGGRADKFFKPNAAPWLPPILDCTVAGEIDEEEEELVPEPPKKKAKQMNMMSFFSKK